jgi:putative membrane protein
MILHALTMSAVAPVAAFGITRLKLLPTWTTFGMLAAATAQIALFLGWHAPAAMAAAMHDGATMMLMHLSLFGAATVFWTGVYASAQAHPWRAIFVLVVSGKLFCLLAALLVFSPRAAFHEVAGADAAGLLADQQTAGLVMLAVCPLTYVAAAIIIAARWLENAGVAPSPSQTPAR